MGKANSGARKRGEKFHKKNVYLRGVGKGKQYRGNKKRSGDYLVDRTRNGKEKKGGNLKSPQWDITQGANPGSGKLGRTFAKSRDIIGPILQNQGKKKKSKVHEALCLRDVKSKRTRKGVLSGGGEGDIGVAFGCGCREGEMMGGLQFREN